MQSITISQLKLSPWASLLMLCASLFLGSTVFDKSAHAQVASSLTAVSSSACLPFTMPTAATLTASSKKVFAHYVSAFPLSIDNADASNDYYARNYLLPSGETYKFAYCGGFIKERPLPQLVRLSGADFELLNSREEVRRAASIGIDGFTFDILSRTGYHWDRFLKMLDAARLESSSFKIVFMPDMLSAYNDSNASTAQKALVDSVVSIASAPALFRLADGRILIAPYSADARPAAWWAGVVQQLNAQGVRVALWPVYVSPWESATSDLKKSVTLEGTSSWGVRTLQGAKSITSTTGSAHAMGLKWMYPVAAQDSRPKDLIYTESSNSQTFHALWQGAIQTGADWVQLITWNDYSESTELSPSTQTQWSFHDLNAYYVSWFKTGRAPSIMRDTLYYFHRIHASSARGSKQPTPYRAYNGAPQ